METFHEKLESRASASKRLKNFYSNSNKRRGKGSPFHLIYFFVLATFAQKLRPSLTSELRFLITAYPSERRDRIDNPSPPRQTFESVENFIKRERTRIWRRRRRRNKEKWDIIRKYYKEESKSKLKFLYIYIYIIGTGNYPSFSIPLLLCRSVSREVARLTIRDRGRAREGRNEWSILVFSRLSIIIPRMVAFPSSLVRARGGMLPFPASYRRYSFRISPMYPYYRRISTKLQPCRREFTVILILISFDVPRIPGHRFLRSLVGDNHISYRIVITDGWWKRIGNKVYIVTCP